MLRAFGHRVTMCSDVLGVVGLNLAIFKLSQQHPTHRNMVAKRTQHVAHNIVTICCVGMLRSFGRVLSHEIVLRIASPGRLPVSPVYNFLQRVQAMQKV